MLCSQVSCRRRDRHETSAWGKLDEHNCYDLLWCIDVLDDILDNRRVVESFHRALKPGGYLTIAREADIPGAVFCCLNGWAHEGHIGEHYIPFPSLWVIDK